MNEFLQGMCERAKQAPQRIAFAESANVDILKTAEQVVATGIGTPVTIGAPTEVEALAADNGVSVQGFEYFDNTDPDLRDELAGACEPLMPDYSHKSLARKAKDPVNCAMLLLAVDRVDCVAAGKEYSTGDVVFAASSFVGLAEASSRRPRSASRTSPASRVRRVPTWASPTAPSPPSRR